MNKENSVKVIQDIVDFYKLNDENNYDYSDKVLIAMKDLLYKLSQKRTSIIKYKTIHL